MIPCLAEGKVIIRWEQTRWVQRYKGNTQKTGLDLWGNFRVNLRTLLWLIWWLNKQEWSERASHLLWFTRRYFSELYRERQRASISTTLAYNLAHGSCHRLRAGQWTKCHRERPSMEAPSNRSDETEMNHDHVPSCSFQQGSAHDLFPSMCDFSRGTTFKDHKSCKCHQSLTRAICPESSLCGQVHSSSHTEPW